MLTYAIVNPRQANLWRSQTVRLLHPSDAEGNEAETARLTVLRGKEAVCRAAAETFATSPARLLTKKLESSQRIEHQDSLEKLFQSAGKLFVRLWTQRPALRCDDLQELQKHRFQVDSPAMQAHALHKLDDPADRSLDGKSVRIVVHPAVFGVGTHDAEHYDAVRVWGKAVVWLDT